MKYGSIACMLVLASIPFILLWMTNNMTTDSWRDNVRNFIGPAMLIFGPLLCIFAWTMGRMDMYDQLWELAREQARPVDPEPQPALPTRLGKPLLRRVK
jgi:hypothetical protein